MESRINVAELKQLHAQYRAEVQMADLSDGTKNMYIELAEYFVRWIEGDFTPGSGGRSRSRRVRR